MYEPVTKQQVTFAYRISNEIFYKGQNIVLPKNKMLEIITDIPIPMGTTGVILSEDLSKQQIFLSQSIFSSSIEHGFLTLKMYNLNNVDFLLRTNQLLGRIVHF